MKRTSGEIHGRIASASGSGVSAESFDTLIRGPLNRAILRKAKLLGPRAHIKTDAGGIMVPSKSLFGCGYFGCVYATEDPNVVLKLTTDESEAQMSSFLASKRYRSGIVKFYQVFEIPGQFLFCGDKRKMFAVWRENAIVAGMIGSDRPSADTADPFPQRAQKLLAEIFLRELPLLDYMSVAEFREIFYDFLDAVHRQYGASTFFRYWDEDLREIFVAALDKVKNPNLLLSDLEPPNSPEGTRDAALLLTHLADLRDTRLGNGIGTFLLRMLLEEEIMLTDAHPGNVGIVKRENLPVLVDPGVVVSLRGNSREPSNLPFYRDLPSIFD